MPGWGMIIEPKKHYKQSVQRSYKITHAVLSGAENSTGNTELIATIQGEPIIACLLNKSTPQVALNLEFSKGEKIALNTRGEKAGAVHLTGYILESSSAAAPTTNGTAQKGESKQKHKDLKKLLDKSLSDEDSDDMDYSQLMEDYDGMGDDSDGGSEGEEEEDDEMGDDDEDSELDEGEENLFGDSDSGEEEEDDEDEEEEEEDEDEVKPPPSKKKKENAQQQQDKKEKKKDQQQQQQAKKEKPAAETNGTAGQQKGKMVNLPGGIKYKDLKEGTGAFAKPGKNIVVYYEGRLQGKNKVFDSCKQGAGFKFALGRGAVIRGWDQGIAGMRVGGKRQLICPPNAAYGAKGSPPVIPPNATLVFDVELRHVN